MLILIGMLYKFNRFYEGNNLDEWGWWLQENNEINPNDLKISEQEIKEIENIDTSLSTNEEMKWLIDTKSKNFLNSLMDESNNILENQWSDEQEKIKAIYSLLKIQKILHPWSITSDIKMNNNMTSDWLLAIVWNNPQGFETVLWKKWVAFLDGFVKAKEKDIVRKVENWEDISLEEWKISLEKSKTYMKKLLGDWDGKNISQMYKILSAHFNDNNFIPAVNALIDKACTNLNINLNTVETTITFNENTKKSGKIKAFQEAIVKWYKTNGRPNELWYNNRNGIDWQLWWKTLKVILDNSWVNEFSYNLASDTKLKDSTSDRMEIIDTWKEADNLPTDIVVLWNFWEFKNWKFEFYSEWEKDCIQSNPHFPNDKFVKIWWKKYYIWELSDNNPEKVKNPSYFKQMAKPYMGFDDQGNRVQFIWTRICFWNFDGNDLIDWSEIILDKDWKQIKSTETGPVVKVWDNDEKIIYTKIRWKENEWEKTSTFEAKWRFEFWDTKRLNDEQLDALVNNQEALVKVLDKCKLLYSETKHKPSEIWRYNLSNIIVESLKKYDSKWYSDIIGQLWWIEDRKWIVQKFLGLKYWMFSNPKNEIKWDKNKEFPKIDGIEYDKENNQWDRICNALKYLSAKVGKKSN